jgi:hypothetical protein
MTDLEADIFRFLFALEQSGTVNMFDAPKYIMRDPRFADLSIHEVRALLFRWMKESDSLRNELE